MSNRIPTISDALELANAYDVLAATSSAHASAVRRINKLTAQFDGPQFPHPALETLDAIAAMARDASQTLRAGVGAASPLQDA